MDLISLNLEAPRAQHRSELWDGHLTPVQIGLLTGSIPNLWRPAVLDSAIARLSGVLAGAKVEAPLRPLLPWIARRLVEFGEVCLLLDSELRWMPVEDFELAGSAAAKHYKSVSVQGPTKSLIYRNVSPDQIAHAVIRPEPAQPWRGQHWRNCGFVVRQLAAVDAALQQDAAAPRGTLLPTAAAESPDRLTQLLDGLRKLAGGLSTHPLLGRQGEQGGPSPQPVRLQTSDMDQLVKARESLSASLAEALGFSRVTLGLGSGGQVSRPDSLRAWISTSGAAWASILQSELERVLERPIVLDLEQSLSRLVPHGQRVSAAARLVAAGWSKEEAERLGGLR